MNVLPERTESVGTRAARAWITCHGHRKPVHPLRSPLWSMCLIQWWFSNKISLVFFLFLFWLFPYFFCKSIRTKSPREIRQFNSRKCYIWSKMNLEAVLFPETWSRFFVSFRHINRKWGIFERLHQLRFWPKDLISYIFMKTTWNERQFV